MEKIWIDFEKLPSDALEQLLRNDCLESEKAILQDSAILQICRILTKRRKEENPGSVIDVEKKWEDFLRYYMDDKN